jgi:hypothetical protein
VESTLDFTGVGMDPEWGLMRGTTCHLILPGLLQGTGVSSLATPADSRAGLPSSDTLMSVQPWVMLRTLWGLVSFSVN